MKYICKGFTWEEAFLEAQKMWSEGQNIQIGQMSLAEVKRGSFSLRGEQVTQHRDFDRLTHICNAIYPGVTSIHLFLIEGDSVIGSYKLLLMLYTVEASGRNSR